MSGWQPVASRTVLAHRAALLARVRDFFAARGVLEVDTPILSAAGTTDPQIESLRTCVSGRDARLLQTSPEFAMKRLLAAGSGDIFQICKVFRDGELGRWHEPEFTLIEWYRLGFDDAALMSEVESLIRCLLAPARTLQPAERVTYRDALRRHANVDMHDAADDELRSAAKRLGIDCRSALGRDDLLDLLMGAIVGPRLGFEQPCFVCDYPASQASLARLRPGEPSVAARFELYMDGVELANGFHELTNAEQQRGRFEHDLAERARAAQPSVPIDERLLAALAHGLPDCAGVALGFDRLAALACDAGDVRSVLSFSFANA